MIERDITKILADLPEICMLQDQMDPEKVIAVKRGETGYWPMPGRSVAFAKRYNERHGITPAQVEAMRLGSMFGFHVPAADPLNNDRATDLV